MCTKKCYLAGPINGMPYYNVDAFHNAEVELSKQGYKVFNPTKETFNDFTGARNSTPEVYRECFKVELNWILDNADAIALLPGWQQSKGCAVEVALAQCLNLEVINL